MYLLTVFGDYQREIERTFFDILQVFVLSEAFCNADLVLERAVSGTFYLQTGMPIPVLRQAQNGHIGYVVG
jgi:hypothetical protein